MIAIGISGCAPDPEISSGTRHDTATALEISNAQGSFQNPCWLPDHRLVFTNFRTAYNIGPSTVSVVDAAGGAPTALTPGTTDEVNMPGSCFDPVRALVAFTSDRTATHHDEVFVVPVAGGPPVQVTDRLTDRAFEPTFSPDGAWIVFESHTLASDADGILYKVRANGTELTQLTTAATATNARQPVWSPLGDKIVFQSPGIGGAFDLFTIDPTGGNLTNVTSSATDETDASFSHDGRSVIYSSNTGGLAHANVFAIPLGGGTPIRITNSDAYDGAPAWSTDGSTIAFESYAGDPDGSTGTKLLLIAAPMLSAVR